jgi:hypothetical protein
MNVKSHIKEEHRLRVFENGVPRKIFGHKRDEVTGTGENCIMRSFVICTPQQILFGSSKSGGIRWARHVAHVG